MTAAPEFSPFLDLSLSPSRDTTTPSQLPAGAGGVEFGFLKDVVVLDLNMGLREEKGLGWDREPLLKG